MKHIPYPRKSLLLLCLGLLLAGCSDSPDPAANAGREQSVAIEDHAGTAAGAYLEELSDRHPGESGFAIIRYPRPAFTSRLVMSDLAEKSLDVQYYIWEQDATGRILAEHLLRAADRGVRVRLLVDDINLSGRDDAIAAMDAHRNIEIRLFNPFSHRRFRFLDFLTNFNRVNHRMHNKLMVMDNALAIVGGRNIGDHYFGVAEGANFRDLDIAAGGPVVQEISGVFDHFWNGDWSVPIAALVDHPYADEDLERIRAQIRRKIEEDPYPHPLDLDIARLKSELRAILDNMVWAPGSIIWDDPATILETGRTSRISTAMQGRASSLQRELLIESAYFVPRDLGIDTFSRLNRDGVRIRVLTNSLSSNDVLAAHAGYAHRRRELLDSGVELHELHPYPGPVPKKVIRGRSKAALHTKAIVMDRQEVFIGSFNLDPRSGDLNTEAGLYVESPEIAAQVIDYMDEGITPANSYRVQLQDDDLVWTSGEGDAQVLFDRDPESSLWQRWLVGLIAMLPIEDQL